jgi:VWFA-related protein
MMCALSIRRRSYYLAVLFWMAFVIPTATAQTKPAKQDQEDVIRVDTTLVQTDVMVFDKQGHFADGLRANQFELKIDNKPQAIAFFERVGSGNQLVEKKSEENPDAAANSPTNSATVAPGRVLIFFVDDLHLAPESLVRTRKALLEFIDHGMAEKDVAAITSSSGQIGFLQQFTDNKAALRSAVARLNYRANTKMDMEQPPMSEYIALKIREGDEQTIAYYAQQIQQQNCFQVNGVLVCMVSPHPYNFGPKEKVEKLRDDAIKEMKDANRVIYTFNWDPTGKTTGIRRERTNKLMRKTK